MDKKRKFSKKALRDFELIDAAIAYNDQNAFAELMANYKNSIYYTILKMIRDPDDAEDRLTRFLSHGCPLKEDQMLASGLKRIELFEIAAPHGVAKGRVALDELLKGCGGDAVGQAEGVAQHGHLGKVAGEHMRHRHQIRGGVDITRYSIFQEDASEAEVLKLRPLQLHLKFLKLKTMLKVYSSIYLEELQDVI